MNNSNSPYPFPALLGRMKLIDRWAMMRNTQKESLQEHSLDVAIIAHALASIRNALFGGTLDANLAAMYGIFHDASEIITGDLPTPIKNFNPAIKEAYKAIEKKAQSKLLSMLPAVLTEVYQPLFDIPDEYYEVVKAADKIAALIKCIEEEKSGNKEFFRAGLQNHEALKNSPLEEVAYFMEHLLPGYRMTLDELCEGGWIM